MTRAARRNFGRHQIAWVSGKGQTVLAPISGKMRRPSLMSLSSPAQKPSKKPDISVKTEPPKSVVTPLRSVNNQSRNNSRSSLGNWTLEIETGSGNSGCLAYTMQLNAVLTRRRLTVNTPKFSSFSGKLKNEWSEEIIGHFMQGHYFYRYKLELFRDNFWQGSWTVLGDQNEGIGCAGALSMRR